jgi:ABC-2 type transport system ATP-binding protein
LIESAGQKPAVETRGLTARYGERTALDALDFVVAPGERVALLGPNGAGKSTLLSILATLLPPSAGTARVMDIDVARDPFAARRRMGIVFQGPSLDRRLSAEENLRLLGRLYGLRGAALSRAVDESLARVELADRRRDRVSVLSGGLARRLEVARALLARPDVLLLDEPTSGLDPAARAEVWEAIEALSREGAAVLYATHLGEEAERAHRVVILDQGRVVAEGDPTSLKAGVGGDVLVVECADPEAFAAAVRERFGVRARAVEGAVLVERERGHEFVPVLVEAFPGQARSVTLRQPTLEDVFVHVTGHRFRVRGST